MKKLLVLFVLVPFSTFAQWDYNNVNSGTIRNATGSINFFGKDEFKFKLIKSKSPDLNFSISSDFFKKDSSYYYVVLTVLGKNFRVTEFESSKANFKIIELKDLSKSDKYTVNDFLKKFKKGIQCIVTIKNKNKIIQGICSLEGSSEAINQLLRS